MDDIAGPDDLVGLSVPLDVRRGPAPDGDERAEGDAEAQVRDPLPIIEAEVVGRRLAGRDDGAREHVGDDAPGDRGRALHDLELFVDERFEPARRQRLGRSESRREGRPDGLLEPGLENGGQPAGRPLDLARVDPDRLRGPLPDDAAEAGPLAFLLARVPGGRVPGVLEKALGVRPRDVDPLDALFRAAVEEDEDLGDGAPVLVGHHRHRGPGPGCPRCR